jgi:hypothetical protein
MSTPENASPVGHARQRARGSGRSSLLVLVAAASASVRSTHLRLRHGPERIESAEVEHMTPPLVTSTIRPASQRRQRATVPGAWT